MARLTCVYSLAENHNLLLTPFERNLQVWRQLWRVIERSHLVVQIVDARNPMTFRCRDLEAYVTELGLIGSSGMQDREEGSSKGRRTNLLLINKSDLLTREQRAMWADYFDKEGIKYAFFSAIIASAENEQLAAEEEARREQEEDAQDLDNSLQDMEESEEGSEGSSDSEDEYESDDLEEAQADIDALTIDDAGGEKKKVTFAEPAAATVEDVEDEDLAVAAKKEVVSQEEDPRTRILSVSELENLFQSAAPQLESESTASFHLALNVHLLTDNRPRFRLCHRIVPCRRQARRRIRRLPKRR